MDSKLTTLQREILDAFFRREQRFFLTGGGALAGFHLGHRTTEDLDLFATTNLLEDGESALRAVAVELHATFEPTRTRPEFRRSLIRRGSEGVVVDLVCDRAPQGTQTKPRHGIIVVDPPQEILANKLCTLLSRSEVRDLVDVCVLERHGFHVEDALPLANQKDGGLTPAQLAWVLSQIKIGEGARIPGGLSAVEVRGYLQDLVKRLSEIAFPT